MNIPTCVHQDHVSAVMDIGYSPFGREFVTGSYDRTVRVFPYNVGHIREICHTKRMRKVFCMKFRFTTFEPYHCFKFRVEFGK